MIAKLGLHFRILFQTTLILFGSIQIAEFIGIVSSHGHTQQSFAGFLIKFRHNNSPIFPEQCLKMGG